ncbi:linear amide C-N hydrolase [Vibrio sp. CAU 1672]|uniref:linear amide C-N hydrolase n=1 Tax=Vibrio sp. CAU 1672 TaxID=3032594 RepID=UPI0023DCC474|nr:linear amide C-N hydrolase [Vibrio sp. CAU 1672]MDF2153480.1 linear amide C-N hydrolase [Vibrio sp. CAU 1672]
MKLKALALSIMMAGMTAGAAHACTSIAWNTESHGTITTRTNDWMESTNPKLGGIVKGEKRYIQGPGVGTQYTVKYDVVAILAYGELDLVHDGVNSEGLQVNTLFYRPMTMEAVSSPEQISQFTLGEYILTNYASVEEVVTALPSLDYAAMQLEAMPVDITLHWSITDKSGDRAVIEMDPDGLKIYRGEEAAVMTNDPSMQEHIDNLKEIKPSWEVADRNLAFGSNGNSASRSRFVHASYFLNWLDEPSSAQNGMMKLSTVAYRVPADAPYMDFGQGMTGYATEWTLSQSLETGDSVFEYNFGENWNTVRYNVYELMGKSFRAPLNTSSMGQLEFSTN